MASLTKWLSVYLHELSGCGFESRCSNSSSRGGGGGDGFDSSIISYIIKNCHKFNAKNLCKHNTQNNFHELTGTLGHNFLEFRNYRILEKV